MWIKHLDWEVTLVKLQKAETEARFYQNQVDELKSKLRELQVRLDQERMRSDEAVDKMLQVRGLPPVSPTEKPPSLEELTSLFDEDPAEVRTITHDIKDRGADTVLLESE